MIVGNTHQLNYYGTQHRIKQNSQKLNTQVYEKVAESTTDKDLSEYSMIRSDELNPYTNRTSNNYFFKQQFSLMSSSAIQQYENLKNLEKLQATSTIFGISEFA